MATHCALTSKTPSKNKYVFLIIVSFKKLNKHWHLFLPRNTQESIVNSIGTFTGKKSLKCGRGCKTPPDIVGMLSYGMNSALKGCSQNKCPVAGKLYISPYFFYCSFLFALLMYYEWTQFFNTLFLFFRFWYGYWSLVGNTNVIYSHTMSTTGKRRISGWSFVVHCTGKRIVYGRISHCCCNGGNNDIFKMNVFREIDLIQCLESWKTSHNHTNCAYTIKNKNRSQNDLWILYLDSSTPWCALDTQCV